MTRPRKSRVVQRARQVAIIGGTRTSVGDKLERADAAKDTLGTRPVKRHNLAFDVLRWRTLALREAHCSGRSLWLRHWAGKGCEQLLEHVFPPRLLTVMAQLDGSTAGKAPSAGAALAKPAHAARSTSTGRRKAEGCSPAFRPGLAIAKFSRCGLVTRDPPNDAVVAWPSAGLRLPGRLWSRRGGHAAH